MAISADSAAESRQLRARLGLNFPLLADPEVVVATAYGVAMKQDDIAIPATFVVLPDRRIAWSHVGETPSDRPTNEQLLEQLELLAANR